MKLDEILEEWSRDHKLDPLKIPEESTKIPVLHEKYARMLSRERRKLRELQIRKKELRLEKYEYLINPTHEKFKEGWKMPSRGGKMYKGEVDTYLDGDRDLLELERRINLQEEKVEQLKSILYHVNQRNFIIRNIVELRKFEEGY